ncbi:MAG: DNA adenine methylase [Endomicrobium sp.]|nr:DNA adenine methylase [Endomicrobium sp.]
MVKKTNKSKKSIIDYNFTRQEKQAFSNIENELSYIVANRKLSRKTIEKYPNDIDAKIYALYETIQGFLFDIKQCGFKAQSYDSDYKLPCRNGNNGFQLHSRRYIGNKYKLIDWIFSIIKSECEGRSFTDIFAGTGVVGAQASKEFGNVIMNDFLYSNYAIYQGFFGDRAFNKGKLEDIVGQYNNLVQKDLPSNYFSKYFGNKYFSLQSAKIIGYIRQDIENNKDNLSEKEYYILLASLIYSIDKIANTVGHFDAYFKKESVSDKFLMKLIEPIKESSITIFREDANKLIKLIKTDILYIDPPYNSRQYSRFYHLYETLIKWDMPKLYGVALKPFPENMSVYCKTGAKFKFDELVKNANANYIVVSYNNTYDSKSGSSRNKISLQEIERTLKAKGGTKVFEKEYRHFNAGNTDFKNHKEFLFVTKVKNGQN